MIDVDIAQTFLKVAETRSFQAAAKLLNVTQSTVSARIRALEERLGRRLFERNRAGAELNQHGRAFQRYAATIVQAWEEGKRVAATGGQEDRLAVGGEHNLWTRLLPLWLLELRAAFPSTRVSAAASDVASLVDGLKTHRLSIAIMRANPEIEGLQVNHLMDDELVLVTTDAAGRYDDRYVDIAWPAGVYSRTASDALGLDPSQTQVDLGFHSINYLIITQTAGYLPRRLVDPYVDAGYLYRAKGAPTYSIPVFAIQRAGETSGTVERALAILRDVASLASRGELPPPFWSQLG